MDNNNPELFHEILSSIKEVIKDIQTDLKEIKEDISEIKLDVNHHILRTNLLEDDQKEQKKIVNQLQKDSWKAKGAMTLLGLIITILGTYALFKH